MREGPDIAAIASLVGDPARANMLQALMDGGALTATELAHEAGVTPPTASAHLSKLVNGGLLRVARQGRHRYYRLASPQVAGMVEAISGVAETLGPKRVRPGPKDAAMRQARVCYDHLAGEQGVALLDALLKRGVIEAGGGDLRLGGKGAGFFEAVGINLDDLKAKRRPLCRACLDWSERRSHLAGALGAAVLDVIVEKKWARRDAGSRALHFTPPGRARFEETFLTR